MTLCVQHHAEASGKRGSDGQAVAAAIQARLNSMQHIRTSLAEAQKQQAERTLKAFQV
jgi:hypothetical protein